MTYGGPERRKCTVSFSESEKDRLFKQVGDIHLILSGNGHPEEGLVFKVAKVTEFMEFWQKFGWLILAGFAGVPCTVIAGIVLHVVKGG